MESPQSNEEDHFYALFQKVLDEIQNSAGVSYEDVTEAIDAINESFDYKNPPADYSQTNVICGYLSRYAAHSAGLARTTMVDAIQNCPKLRSALEKEGELRVVSIGGGPASDALGFCSALCELELLGWTSLRITVVDAAEKWGECVTLIDQYLREEEEFGSVSNLFKEKEVAMAFVQANLPGNPKEDTQCYEALREADVVLEVKMLCRLNFRPRKQIIEALFETVRDDALVLPIHKPYYDKFWIEDGYFTFLYKPVLEVGQTYRLTSFHERFGFSDNTKSNAHIRVLRKRRRRQAQLRE